MAKRPDYDPRVTKKRLVLASMLLNAVIVATFLTSSQFVSPAGAWMTALDKAYYRLDPVISRPALEDLHAGAGKLTKEQCVACHGSMVGSKLVLHRIHLLSELLPGLSCHDCHRQVSLERKSNAKVVRLVDVSFCKKCHSPFTGLSRNSTMKPVDFQADCTTCHSGKHAFEHAQPYLSQVIAPRECSVCHGGRVLPWVPGHELDTWIQEHGREALAVGVDSCMKCHEYGLEFCNDCHKKRPPFHEPRDVWLLRHPARARADTRVCFACHKADDCKECHVNHTAGWVDRHGEHVLSKGIDLCRRCHSTTFCPACHKAKPSGITSGAAPVGP